MTLAARLRRLERGDGAPGARVMGVVEDRDYAGDRPGVVTVQPGGLRVSVAEFGRRWPGAPLAILTTWDDDDAPAA